MSRREPILAPQIGPRKGGKKRGWRRKHLHQQRAAEREEILANERAQHRFKQWLRRNPTAEEVTPKVMRPSLDS